MELKTKHAFKLLVIVKKANMIDTLKGIMKSNSLIQNEDEKIRQQKANELGLEFIMELIEKLPLIEKDLYELLGEVKGKTPVEIQEQSLNETIDDIKEIFSDSQINSFFK